MPFLSPDYTCCGLNLISSIAGHLGLPLGHGTLPLVDALLSTQEYQNIVLMLFDGMGMDLLERALPSDAFLRRHVAQTLSAVYPSTTTCATSTIECGLAPREHAWLGWTLYFPQIQKPVDVFLNRSNGEIAADYNVADRFIPREMIFPRITAAGRALATCVSPHGDPAVYTLDALFDTALTLCRDEKRRYIYTYWNEPDHTMHEEGCHTEHVHAIVRNLNARVEAFAAALPEHTLLMLTADHGLIDGEFLYLDDYPALRAMLRHDPTMESRAASLHVKPEFAAAFPTAFRAAFGDRFLLITGAEFIRDYLGSGTIHPAVYDFVGDYMALATGPYCLSGQREEHCLKGVHAGLTPQEMLVPLVVVPK